MTAFCTPHALSTVKPLRDWRILMPLLVVSIVILVLLFTGGTATAARVTENGLTERLRQQTTTIRGEKLQVALLLRAIGRKTGVNIIVDEAIADTISLDLQDVNLYDLFRLILETRGLRYYESNNALVITKMEDFIKEQRDIVTARLCPRYAQASAHLQELEVLKSEEGNLTVSADGNCVVVRDHEKNVVEITRMLETLDRPMPQVHIKARIVTIDKSLSKDLGIKWGYTYLDDLPDDSFTGAADLGATNPAASLVFGFIRDTFTLDLELSALQERNQLDILSEPRIVVLDGQEAEIKQGQEVPYESGTAENRDTSFREAVLGLKVTPKILQNKNIRLDVTVTNDSVDESSTPDGQPLLNRQEISTKLFLEDGVTAVIGGILSKGVDETKGEVPWFADIPYVGKIFSSTERLDRTFELLVFLTPTIITTAGVNSDSYQTTVDLLQRQREREAKESSALSADASATPPVPRTSKVLLRPLELKEGRE